VVAVNVGRVVDLSMPVGRGTVVYPGDLRPELRPAATIERDGFNVLQLRMGSHTGTHVDAPYHVDPAGRRLDELDLRLFAGPGVVVDATHLAARGRIGWDVLAPYAGRLRPGAIVLLRTGWGDSHRDTAGSPGSTGRPFLADPFLADPFLDHPFLDAGACRRLLDLGVRTICIDTINIDETPDSEHPGEGFPAHHLIAEAGGVIGESFRNLDLIDFADPFVTCLPIALEGGDGAPVRAVAVELLP
jgi:kynurenine formamidase